MQLAKFKVGIPTAVIVFACIVSIHSGMSLLKSIPIPNRGSIRYSPIETPAGAVAYQSEIRAMYIHISSMNNPDFEVIAQTCKDYGINTLLLDCLYPYYCTYPSDILPGYPRDNVGLAVSACHTRGMTVHVIFCMGIGPYGGTEAVGADGGMRSWTCFSKAATRAHFKNLVEELATKYNIDGIMLDYGRYDGQDFCYCDECRAKFAQYLGETVTISDFRTGGKFAPGGARYTEFMEWRTIPINEMVALVRSWGQAIKPNLEVSGCVWGWLPGNPAMNRYYLGQDPMAWIKEGSIDWLSPMSFYMQRDPNTIKAQINQYHQDLGGPEGIVPLVAFLDPNAPEFGIPTPTQFAAIVDAVRTAGADGFALNRYGGPGDGQGSGNADIRPFLQVISNPPVSSLNDIKSSAEINSCTITWTTDLPATSKVEYSKSPVFTASFNVINTPVAGYHYWDMDHVPGTIAEDTTPVTDHSITLTGLSPGTKYYFRVQSQDANGVATSKVLTFSTT